MNWTGGWLQRHSKANADNQLKTQKRFLARARQQRVQTRNARPLPSAFSLFNDQRGGRQPRLARPPPRSVQGPQHQTPRQEDAAAGNIHCQNSVVVISSTPVSDRNPLEPKTGTCIEDALRAHDRKEPTVDSLDPIKRRLLVIPDWAGLNPTKPVQMKFTPAEEMERFGRRRGADTAERHKKQNLSRARIPHHHTTHPIRHFNKPMFADPLQLDDFSIRMGSDIHKTQTSLGSIPQRTRLPASQSSESMLLDKFDARVRGKSDAKTDSRRLIHFEQRGDEHDPAQNLVPLDEVRDLKSWDEVLDRSSSRSLVAAKPPSSTPFIEPNPGAVSVAVRSNFVLPPLRTSGVDSENILRSTKAKANVDEVSVGECTVPMTSGVGDKEPYEPQVRTTSRRPPCFTLEKQVAMEQEFLGNISYSMHHQSDMRPSQVTRPRSDDNTGLAYSESITDQSSLSDVNLNSPVSAVDYFTYHNVSQQSACRKKCYDISNRLADENDTWMKSVFPKDFERIQNDFSFRKPLRVWKTQQDKCTSEPFGLVTGGTAVGQLFTPDSYHTEASQDMQPPNADSTIFDHTWQSNRNQLELTLGDETSFLPRFSPMTSAFAGVSGSISTTNDRIFVPQNDEASIRETHNRRLPLKRTAEQAFPDASSSHHLRRPSLQPANPSPSIAESTPGLLGTAQGFVNNSIDSLQQTPTQSFISAPSSTAPTVGHALLPSEGSQPPACDSFFNDFRMLHTPC